MATESPFRTLVRALHAQLLTVLEAEGRLPPPDLAFGKIEWKRHVTPPRIVWIHGGGRFSGGYGPVTTPVEGAPAPVMGARIAIPTVMLHHKNEEEVEHLLDRLWLATDRLPEPNLWLWKQAHYTEPTELDGLLEKGHVIELTLPVELPVPAEYDGESVITTLDDTQLRAGQEDVLDTTTPGQPQFQLSEWT